MWPESLQAKIALGGGLVVALMAALTSVFRAKFFGLVSVLVFTLPMVFLVAYDIQCVVTGQCDVYGWIKTVVFMLAVAVTFYLQAASLRPQPRSYAHRVHEVDRDDRDDRHDRHDRHDNHHDRDREASWEPRDLNESVVQRNRDDDRQRDATGNRIPGKDEY